MPQEDDKKWMARALALAQRAADQDEVPVGAVVVHEGRVVGEGWNQPITLKDPTAHAEIMAMRQAAQTLDNYRLLNSELYVTLEPCAMCMGAIMHARVQRLVFGAWDPRAGAVRSVFHVMNEPKLNHQMQWSDGVMAHECGDILKQFFEDRRN